MQQRAEIHPRDDPDRDVAGPAPPLQFVRQRAEGGQVQLEEEGEIAGKVADRIQLGVVAYAKKGAGSEWNPVQIMAPSVRGTKILEGWSIPWPRWSTVRFKSSLKQSYWIVAKAFSKLSGDSKPQ